MRSMNSSDKALIQRWQRDADGEAFAELVRRHAAMVFGAANRILRNAADAEEIAQESFAKIGEIRRLRGESAGGLLHTIATHLAINRLNAESKRRAREIEFATLNNAELDSDWESVAPHVDEAIASLSPAQRESVVRHYLDGQSYRAIARAQQLDESTVRHHAQRGLERIRRFLKRRGISTATATIGAGLTAHAEAVTLSTPLLTALGKQAIAGPPVLSGMNSAASIALGGSAIMMKKVALGLGAAATIAASVVTWQVVKRDKSQELALGDNEPVAQLAVSTSAQPFINRGDEDTLGAQPNRGDPSAMEPVTDTERDVLSDEEEEAFAALVAKALGFNDAIGPAGPSGVNSDEDSSFRSEDLPEDNGMHYFLKASELLAGQRDMKEDDWERLYRRLAAGETLTGEELARYNEMQDAIDYIRIGLEVGNVSLPIGNEGPDTLLPFLSIWRYTARIMNLDAEFLMSTGNYDAGLDGYKTIVAFGSELGRGGPLINGLVGIAVGGLGTDSLLPVLSQGDLTVDEYRAVIASLQDVQTNALAHWETLINEQAYTVEWFEEVSSTPGALRQFLDSSASDSASSEAMHAALQAMPDDELIRYFREYREDYERMVQYSTLPYYEAVAYLEDAEAFTPNVISSLIMPAMSATMTAYARRDAQLQGTIAVAAIEAYRIENGSYPRSLDVLVPDYLVQPALDPFTGATLRYRPRYDGYRLYSTGADMTDDGGLVHGYKKPGEDMVFHK